MYSDNNIWKIYIYIYNETSYNLFFEPIIGTTGCDGQWPFEITYCGVLSKWEFFIKMWAVFLASILPWVMKEEESKEGSSHFDEKLSIW